MSEYKYKGYQVNYVEGPWDGYYTVTTPDGYDNLADESMTVLESEEDAEKFIDALVTLDMITD
jgi:hypothetical protein